MFQIIPNSSSRTFKQCTQIKFSRKLKVSTEVNAVFKTELKIGKRIDRDLAHRDIARVTAGYN